MKQYLIQIQGVWELQRQGYISCSTARGLEDFLISMAVAASVESDTLVL
jgi:hypothetical protein